MIDVIESIYEALDGIESIHGKVFRRWPSNKALVPSVLISRLSATPTFTDSEGHEIIATIVYSVDINAKTSAQADSIAEEVVDALARMNFHRQGDMEFYDDALRVHRRIMSFGGSVDTRGNTFRN